MRTKGGSEDTRSVLLSSLTHKVPTGGKGSGGGTQPRRQPSAAQHTHLGLRLQPQAPRQPYSLTTFTASIYTADLSLPMKRKFNSGWFFFLFLSTVKMQDSSLLPY